MSLITYANKAIGKWFTAGDANEIKAAVNDNHARTDAIEAIEGILKVAGGSPAAAVAGVDFISPTGNLVNPADQTWQGKTAAGVAGGAMTSANRWAPLYCKDGGSGTRWYLYNPDASNSDNDLYLPTALLVTGGSIAAGGAITVTEGDGVLANDTWAALQSQVGTALFCADTGAGHVGYAAPNGAGDVIKQIGTLKNIAANGRDVWSISFSHPAVVVQ